MEKEGKRHNNMKAFNAYTLTVLSHFPSFPFNTCCVVFLFIPLIYCSFQGKPLISREWLHSHWDSTNDLFEQPLLPIIHNFDLISDTLQ